SVASLPGDLGLGFGQEEAIRDEGAGREIEFAGDVGIRSAARELDQGALEVRRQSQGPMPYPNFLVRLRQRIQIEDGLPRRLVLPIVRERGAAPESARVILVAPEVVVGVADLLHVRNLGVGVEDREES